jgi:hypothetical protein
MGGGRYSYDAGYKLKVIAYAQKIMETEQLSGISALHQQEKRFAIGGLVKKN